MTAQIPERLHYQGWEGGMRAEPLELYLAMGGTLPAFRAPHTGLGRGYLGHWRIRRRHLYLESISGTLRDGSQACLAALFPGYPDRVFAHWYSGTLRPPRGKVLAYVHAGHASVHERDVMLEVERGVLRHAWVRHNALPAPGLGEQAFPRPPVPLTRLGEEGFR